MRAYLTIKMDRPIDDEKHYISPGGYEVTAAGKRYQFDFNEYYGCVDNVNPSIIHCELRDEDADEFPEINEFREHLHEITELNECYIYTGENDEPEIHPIKLLAFKISDSGVGKRTKFPRSTKFVKCTPYATDNDWMIDYEFTEALLNTCEFEK